MKPSIEPPPSRYAWEAKIEESRRKEIREIGIAVAVIIGGSLLCWAGIYFVCHLFGVL